MNDFFLATNESITNELGITVKQITVKDLGTWFQHAEPIRLELKKDYSDESIEKVFNLHKMPSLFLCKMTTDKTNDELISLVSNDFSNIITLLKSIIEVNIKYFDQEDAKKSRSTAKSESSWFDSFQLLINSGHDHNDIMNMSYGAFIMYTKATSRKANFDLARLANAMRMAQHASNSDYEKLIKKLG